jgi:hypothetical protein
MDRLVTWIKAWKLASWRTALVAALVLYGLVGFFLAPVIAERLMVRIVQERTGREVVVGDVSCNPFALSLTIRDFSVSDRPGTTLVSFDEFYANAQVSSLLRWAATLKELRVENPYAGIRRFPDGGINLLELLEDIRERTPPSDEADGGGGLPRALLQDILANGVTLEVEDLAREEPLDWMFGPSRFELHGISTIPEHRGDHELLIAMHGGGSAGVTGNVVLEPLGLDGRIEVEGLDLGILWEALGPFFQFDVVEGAAGGALSYSVTMSEEGFRAAIDEADFLLRGLEVTAGEAEETILRVGSVVTTDVSAVWPEAQVRGASIVVEGAEAFQWIRPDGTPSWDRLVPEETRERTVEIYREVEAAFPWDIALDGFEVRGAVARVEDRTFSEPLEIVVDEVGLGLTNIRTGPGNRWGLTASARLLGEGRVGAEGSVRTGPMSVEAQVDLQGVPLSRAQPYLERVTPLQVRSGTLETSGVARASGGGVEPVASFAGDLRILDFDIGESVLGTDVLGWERVDVRGIDAGVGPIAVEIEAVDVEGASLEIVVSEDGSINLLEVVAAMREGSEGPAEGDEGEGGGLPPVSVRTINLASGSGVFTDRSLSPTFTLAVEPVEGTIEGVSNTGPAGAVLDLQGSVRTGGGVRVQGEMDLLDPKRLTSIEINVLRADLPPVSPMSVRFIGHPIEEGRADVALRYDVVSSDLEGNNRLVTQGLTLGDKVEGEGKVNLPFKLGVSLLTDSEGRITLEFPVSGNLEDPAFVLSSAMGSAATEIVSQVIQSPFRLLGRLGGGSGDEDLGGADFASGSAELEQMTVDRLRLLGAGAVQRPDLVLLVQGTWDPEMDGAGLQEAALQARLGDREASMEVLEALAREMMAAETIDALRAEHMVIDETSGERALDEAAYFRELRAMLIEGQPLDQAELRALAVARGEAIRLFLVDGAGLDADRVRTVEPAPVETPSGEGWVRSRLDVDSGG